MALPKQVQKQLKEVEAYEKALEAQRNPEAVQDTDPEPLETGAEVVTETEEVTAPEEVEPADTSPTDVEDGYKHKYSTLQSKYNAEVPRLHQQVREMTEVVTQLQAELKELKAEPTKPKEKVSLVTDEDRAEFGEELLDVQRRIAKEVAQEYEDRFIQQEAVNKALEEKLAQTGSQIGEVGFSQRLAQLVPDFAEIDKDERWMSWLNEHDPMLRGPRRSQAQAAFDAGDAEAVAHYVGLWRETLTSSAPSDRPVRQAELEKQVAPSRSANSVKQPTNPNAKMYSTNEINAAWNKVSLLMRRGKLDEATKLEAELSAAYTEGRVQL